MTGHLKSLPVYEDMDVSIVKDPIWHLQIVTSINKPNFLIITFSFIYLY